MGDYVGNYNPGRQNYLVQAARAAGIAYRHRDTIKKVIDKTYKMADGEKVSFGKKRSAAASSKGDAAPLKGKPVYKKPRRKTCKGISGKTGQKICQIENQIKQLKYSENASLGTMTWRNIQRGSLLPATNKQASVNKTGYSVSTQGSMLQYLKYFDPNNPGTLLVADGDAGTYQRKFLIKSQSAHIEFRNNYQQDIRVKVYLCKPKDDTSVSTIAAWQAGILDGSNATDENDINQYPTDYSVFNSLWHSKVVGKFDLCPGQSAKVSHTEKNVEYNPAVVDTHALSYQKEYKNFQFLIVAEGLLGHDPITPFEVGLSKCGIDWIMRQTAIISYDAGENLKFLVLDNELVTPSQNHVQSQKPTSNNQAYSAA